MWENSSSKLQCVIIDTDLWIGYGKTLCSSPHLIGLMNTGRDNDKPLIWRGTQRTWIRDIRDKVSGNLWSEPNGRHMQLLLILWQCSKTCFERYENISGGEMQHSIYLAQLQCHWFLQMKSWVTSSINLLIFKWITRWCILALGLLLRLIIGTCLYLLVVHGRKMISSCTVDIRSKIYQ